MNIFSCENKEQVKEELVHRREQFYLEEQGKMFLELMKKERKVKRQWKKRKA